MPRSITTSWSPVTTWRETDQMNTVLDFIFGCIVHKVVMRALWMTCMCMFVYLVQFRTVLSSLFVPGNSSMSGSGQTLQVGAVALGNHHQPLLRLHLQPGWVKVRKRCDRWFLLNVLLSFFERIFSIIVSLFLISFYIDLLLFLYFYLFKIYLLSIYSQCMY